jgi:hypothetical protein
MSQEHQTRGPVVTRKNADRSHNGDTAKNSAVIFMVSATAAMADLNILTCPTAHLDECGCVGGKPLAGPTLEWFLPWNTSPEDLNAWAQPPPRMRPTSITPLQAWSLGTATVTTGMPSHRTSEDYGRTPPTVTWSDRPDA